MNKFDYWRLKKRDLGPENLDIFKKYISDFAFTGIYNSENPNAAFECFLDNFQMLYLCYIFVFHIK